MNEEQFRATLRDLTTEFIEADLQVQLAKRDNHAWLRNAPAEFHRELNIQILLMREELVSRAQASDQTDQ